MNLEDVLLRDTRANQPAAATLAEGTLFFVTDESVTEQVRSSAWVDYSDAGGGLAINQLTGDVTAGPGTGSEVATIANNAVTTAKIIDEAVTNAKLANIDTARIKGRVTAATGDVEDLTGTQATTLLDNVVGDAGAGGTKGLVPAPAAGDAAADKFLKASGAWVAVSGIGGINQLTSDVTAGPGTGSQAATLAAKYKVKAINITIDGGGSVITTGVKGYLPIPYACTITKAIIVAEPPGAIVIDVLNDTYANYPPTASITAAAPPTITATDDKSEDSTLTGWSPNLAVGDVVGFEVISVATITRATLQLVVSLT